MKAKIYDKMMSVVEKKMLLTKRKKLINEVRGKVIEFGAGTGINFQFYNDLEVVAIEPDLNMVKHAKSKVGERNINIVNSSATCLPYEDNSFDSVIITLALCTISNPKLALEEAKRVCKDGGYLYVLEHIRNDNRHLAFLQDILTPIWSKFAMGCELNRDTIALIKSLGFVEKECHYFFGRNFIYGIFKNRK